MPPPPLPQSYANTQDFAPTTNVTSNDDWATDWGFGPMPTPATQPTPVAEPARAPASQSGSFKNQNLLVRWFFLLILLYYSLL